MEGSLERKRATLPNQAPEYPQQTIRYIFSLMSRLIEVLEMRLLVVCCEIKMEVESWGIIIIWENV